jgi:hypothetical protein
LACNGAITASKEPSDGRGQIHHRAKKSYHASAPLDVVDQTVMGFRPEGLVKLRFFAGLSNEQAGGDPS